MEKLETLTNLQELWLGRNRIKAINLYGLKCIKKLSLQSNRLTSMLGLQVLNFRKMFYSIYMKRAFRARTVQYYLIHLTVCIIITDNLIPPLSQRTYLVQTKVLEC
jgi:Leucine-rich repeat (LRR) protein